MALSDSEKQNLVYRKTRQEQGQDLLDLAQIAHFNNLTDEEIEEAFVLAMESENDPDAFKRASQPAVRELAEKMDERVRGGLTLDKIGALIGSKRSS